MSSELRDYQRAVDQQDKRRAAARENAAGYVRGHVRELARVLRRQGWTEEEIRAELLRVVDEVLQPEGKRQGI